MRLIAGFKSKLSEFLREHCNSLVRSCKSCIGISLLSRRGGHLAEPSKSSSFSLSLCVFVHLGFVFWLAPAPTVASGNHPFDPYMLLLKVGGVMALVGFPGKCSLEVLFFALILIMSFLSLFSSN